MSRSLTIAIIGGGTAGLAAALLLGRAGHKVTLVERFGEPQPLGSGLAGESDRPVLAGEGAER